MYCFNQPVAVWIETLLPTTRQRFRTIGLPTVSALICAQSATHSSQMKTHRDVARLLHPPSMRFRTSCCDLPQNEQDNCSGAAIRDIWQSPSWLPITCGLNMRARTECVKRPDRAADVRFISAIQPKLDLFFPRSYIWNGRTHECRRMIGQVALRPHEDRDRKRKVVSWSYGG